MKNRIIFLISSLFLACFLLLQLPWLSKYLLYLLHDYMLVPNRYWYQLPRLSRWRRGCSFFEQGEYNMLNSDNQAFHLITFVYWDAVPLMVEFLDIHHLPLLAHL